MRKLSYSLVFLIFCFVSAFSQSCLPEGITFETQAQIDSFQIYYTNCTEIEGDVTIDGGWDIVNLTGLNVLMAIGGDLRIEYNLVLTSLSGLNNLTTIGGSLWIFHNESLTNLSGIENLVSIGEELHIGEWEFDLGNSSLTSIQALANLSSIGGILEISNNPELTSLIGLDNIDASSITHLYIFNNTSLSHCDVQSVCTFLGSPTGSVNIYNNAFGCNNSAEVSAFCGLQLGCLPYGNYYFVNQNEIDNFQSNYPGCFQLQGGVSISGQQNITNLNGLNVITSIENSLSIYDNWILSSLSGLDSLTYVGGDLFFGAYGMGYNYALSSFSGLENLDSIGGNLIISNNLALESLNGLEGLTSIGQWFWLGFTPSLTSITALSNLTNVGGSLQIGTDYPENLSLTNLRGLESLSSIGGSLQIFGMASLTDISDLGGLTSIPGRLSIYGASDLPSLTGLDNATTIGQGIELRGNIALTSLTALNNVTTIGGYIDIEGCHNLASLTGLDNINAATITKLYIHENNSLSICEVQSVCDYLANPSGEIYILDNAPGCNSQQEVEDACEAVSIDEMFQENYMSIYPNPALHEVNILVDDGREVDEVSIYTLTGQQILKARPVNGTIDISDLQPGMYIVEVLVENRKLRQKLLVE